MLAHADHFQAMTDTQAQPTAAGQPGTSQDTTPDEAAKAVAEVTAALPAEVGGAPGPEPTRYGDWAHKGRCTDF